MENKQKSLNEIAGKTKNTLKTNASLDQINKFVKATTKSAVANNNHASSRGGGGSSDNGYTYSQKLSPDYNDNWWSRTIYDMQQFNDSFLKGAFGTGEGILDAGVSVGTLGLKIADNAIKSEDLGSFLLNTGIDVGTTFLSLFNGANGVKLSDDALNTIVNGLDSLKTENTLHEDMGGLSETIQGAEDFIKRDLTTEALDSSVGRLISNRWAADLVTGNSNSKSTSSTTLDRSHIANASDLGKNIIVGTEQGLGQLGSQMLIGKAGFDPITAIGISAGGSKVAEELNNGMSLDKAIAYGIVSGATEAGIESLFGGMANSILGIEGAINIESVVNKILGKAANNKILKVGLTLLGDATGEGIEEVLSNICDDFYKSVIEENKSLNESAEETLRRLEKEGTLEDDFVAFVSAALSTLVFGGGAIINEYQQDYISKDFNSLKEAYYKYQSDLIESDNQYAKDNDLKAYKQRNAELTQKYKETTQSIKANIDNNYKELSDTQRQELQMQSDFFKGYDNNGVMTDEVFNNYINQDVLRFENVREDLTDKQASRQFETFKKNNKQELNQLRSFIINATKSNVKVPNIKFVNITDKSSNAVYYDTNDTIAISINKSKSKTLKQIFSHELMHSVYFDKNIKKELKKQFFDGVFKDEYSKYEQRVKDANYKDKLITEETYALMFEEKVGNTDFIDKMLFSNPNIFKKILKRMKMFAKSFKKSSTLDVDSLVYKFENALKSEKRLELIFKNREKAFIMKQLLDKWENMSEVEKNLILDKLDYTDRNTALIVLGSEESGFKDVNPFLDETGFRYSKEELLNRDTEFNKTMGDGLNGLERTAEYCRKRGYTEDEIKAMTDRLTTTIDVLTNYAKDNGYKTLDEYLNKRAVVNFVNGKLVLQALVSNGDYVVNFDLSATCKKKVIYQDIIETLAKEHLFDFNNNLSTDSIRKIQDVIRDYGFETPCTMCFVEARRLQQFAWANNGANLWNEAVLKIYQENNLDANKLDYYDAAMFNTNEQMQDIEEIIKANQSESIQKVGKNPKGNRKYGGKNNPQKVYNIVNALYKANPNAVKFIHSQDLITGDGLVGIKKISEEFFSILTSSYGAGTPKMNRGAVAYTNEVLRLNSKLSKQITGNAIQGFKDEYSRVKKAYKGDLKGEKLLAYLEDTALRNVLYRIGGARMQSFSDFRIEQVLDVLELFNDLAIRGLPSESYTKEWAFIELFGLTGNKANMSLISRLRQETNNKYLAGLKEIKNKSEATRDILIELVVDEKGNPIIENDKVVFATENETRKTKYYTTDFITSDDIIKGSKEIGKKSSKGFRDDAGLAIQSFPFDKSMKIFDDPKYEEYSKYCGTIAIGFSDAHIKAMLDSKYISMVIPYHSSGMIEAFSIAYFFDNVADYTDVQETKINDETLIIKKNGKIVTNLDKNAISKIKEHMSKNFDFYFNGELQKAYNENMTQEEKNLIPKQVAQKYVDKCIEGIKDKKITIEYETDESSKITKKNKEVEKVKVKDSFEISCTFIPKFSQFINETNYYKLLADFSLYDKYGNYAPQTNNTCALPSDFNDIIKKHLGTALYIENAYKEAKPKMMGEISDIVKDNVPDEFEKPKKKKKKEVSFEEGGKESRNENYGYHFGDSGKAESYEKQTGERSAGHFGTGVYFSSEDATNRLLKNNPKGFENIENILDNNGISLPFDRVEINRNQTSKLFDETGLLKIDEKLTFFDFDEKYGYAKLIKQLKDLSKTLDANKKKQLNKLIRMLNSETYKHNNMLGNVIFDWALDKKRLLEKYNKDTLFLKDYVNELKELNIIQKEDIKASLRASNVISLVNTQVRTFKNNVSGREFDQSLQPMIKLLSKIQTKENLQKGLKSSKGTKNVWFKNMNTIRSTIKEFVSTYFDTSNVNSPFYELLNNELQSVLEYNNSLEDGEDVGDLATPLLDLKNQLILLGNGEFYGKNNGQYTKGNQIMHYQEAMILSDLFSFVNTFLDNYQKLIFEGRKVDVIEFTDKFKSQLTYNYKLNTKKLDNNKKMSFKKLTSTYNIETSKASVIASMFDGTLIGEKGFVGEIVTMLDDALVKKRRLIFDMTEDYNNFKEANKKYIEESGKVDVEITDATGKTFKISRQQALSLFFLCKRQQALYHFNKDLNKTAQGIQLRNELGIRTGTIVLNDKTIDKFNSMFVDEKGNFINELDKEYVQKIEYILKDVQSKIKEIQMTLYGKTNAIDPNYFPIKNDYYNKPKDIAKIENYGDLLYNLGMLKDVVRGASTKIDLMDVDYVISDLVNKATNYYCGYLPMQNINMMLKQKIGDITIKEMLDTYGGNKSFERWLTTLCNSAFQINLNRSEVEQFFAKLRSASVTATFGLNVKIWLTQFASYPLALTQLGIQDLGYGLKGFKAISSILKKGKINSFTEQYRKYAPKTFIRTYNSEVIKAEANSDSRFFKGKKGLQNVTNFLQNPISLNDAVTIYMIWEGCQNKIARTKGLKIGTEENKIEAGKLLDNVVSQTQPMYNVMDKPTIKLENNGVGSVVNNILMFTTMPFQMTSILNKDKTLIKNYRERMKYFKEHPNAEVDPFGKTKADLESQSKSIRNTIARDSAAIVSESMMFALICASMIKALGKDDDEEYGKVVADQFVSSMISVLPITRLLYSTFIEGYDLNTNPISTTIDAGQSVASLIQNPSIPKLMTFLKYVSASMGIPFKNLTDYLYPILNTFSPDLAYKYRNLFYNQSLANDIKIIDKGVSTNNDSLAIAGISNYARKKGSTNISDAAYQSIYNDIIKNDSSKVSIVGVTSYDGESTIKLADGGVITPSKSLNSKLQSDYCKSVNSIVSNPYYSKLSTEYKTKAIKSLSTTIKVSTALSNGQVSTNKLANAVKYFGFDPAKLTSLCYYLKQLKTDSKYDKTQILNIISKLSLTSIQKLVLKNLLGYALTDDEKKKISNSVSLSKSNKDLLLKYL